MKNMTRTIISKRLDAALLWVVLSFAILCSLSLSFAIILLFVFIKPAFVYFTAGLFGLMFGMLFEAVLSHIDWFETKHHIIGGLVIFSILLLNMLVLSTPLIRASPLFSMAEIPQFGRLIIGVMYMFFFAVPFVVHKISSKRFY